MGNFDKDFNLDLDFDFGLESKTAEEVKESKKKEKADEIYIRTRNTEGLKRTKKAVFRRAFSESQLMDAVGIEFKESEVYNCLTGGDVDALSYLKLMIRVQDLEHCLLSTWCMAIDDVLQLEEWVDKGKIKKLDAYVGEIFRGSYAGEYHKLCEVVERTGGKVVMFRNHSKIFAGYGKKFYFGIQTSANINTNPRTENGCIQIGKDIYDFYKDFYERIKGF